MVRVAIALVVLFLLPSAGGSWNYITKGVRSASRTLYLTTQRNSYVGLRVARTLD
jgi:formylglycine-generating enzyme required for sulfatase activity